MVLVIIGFPVVVFFAKSFGLPNIISVIVIAFVLAAAILHLNEEAAENEKADLNDKAPLLSNNKSSSDDNTSSDDLLQPKERRTAQRMYGLCQELTWISNVVIGWIIGYAPICVGFLVALSLATAGGLLELLESVGVYCLSTIFGLFVHITLSLPAMYYYFTGENPYVYLYECRQAPLVAFSTASSVRPLHTCAPDMF